MFGNVFTRRRLPRITSSSDWRSSCSTQNACLSAFATLTRIIRFVGGGTPTYYRNDEAKVEDPDVGLFGARRSCRAHRELRLLPRPRVVPLLQPINKRFARITRRQWQQNEKAKRGICIAARPRAAPLKEVPQETMSSGADFPRRKADYLRPRSGFCTGIRDRLQGTPRKEISGRCFSLFFCFFPFEFGCSLKNMLYLQTMHNG